MKIFGLNFEINNEKKLRETEERRILNHKDRIIQCNKCGATIVANGFAMDTLGFRGQCNCGNYLYDNTYTVIQELHE